MEVAARDITFNNYLTIVPISDLHLGSSACDVTKLEATRKWVLEKPDRLVIGVGDYADLILRQDMKRFEAGCTNIKAKDLDQMLNIQRDMVIDFFKPLADAGRLLGLGEGNHEYEMHRRHSFDLMSDVCKKLKVPNIGYSFFYRLSLKKKRGGVVRNCVIYGHHGFGGGRKPGASINKLVDMSTVYDADIIISGHDHYKLGKRLIRLCVTPSGKPRIINKPVVIARTGTFLRTSIEGFTTYSEKNGFPPTDTGNVRIYINFKGHEKNLDIHVSE